MNFATNGRRLLHRCRLVRVSRSRWCRMSSFAVPARPYAAVCPSGNNSRACSAVWPDDQGRWYTKMFSFDECVSCLRQAPFPKLEGHVRAPSADPLAWSIGTQPLRNSTGCHGRREERIGLHGGPTLAEGSDALLWCRLVVCGNEVWQGFNDCDFGAGVFTSFALPSDEHQLFGIKY